MGIHILILGTHLNSLSPERRRIIVFKLMRYDPFLFCPAPVVYPGPAALDQPAIPAR